MSVRQPPQNYKFNIFSLETVRGSGSHPTSFSQTSLNLRPSYQDLRIWISNSES